jgi:hypothetical protein
VAAVFLCLPSLRLGLQVDDYIFQLMLMEDPPDRAWSRPSGQLFVFINGDEEVNRSLISAGGVPWWLHPQLKLAFFRPLTGFTHWIDFRIWPRQPWLMHIQSLLWFAGAIAAAALLYRRLLLPAWVAGLAGLLFAVDDAHGLPAVWLANRNASIGVFFGLLSLIAHHRWRREGWRPGALIGPLALLAGLLGGEIALAAGGYLLAYELFLDTDTWRRRIVALVPSGAIGVAWWVAYRGLGYGTNGSGVYIDPGADPLLFTRAAFERAPLLFSGLWGLPSNLQLMLSKTAGHVLWAVAVGVILVVVLLLSPLLRRNTVARFFALGMVLSLVPACATFPDDRLLFFASFGGMGLLAQFMKAVRSGAEWVPSGRLRQLPYHAFFWLMVVIHVVLAPLGLAMASAKVRMVGGFIEPAARSLPTHPEVTDQTVVIVNVPSAFLSVYSPLIQGLQGRTVPGRTLTLASGIYPMTVIRRAADVLTIRPDGGYLASPGSPRPGDEKNQPAFNPLHFCQMLDYLYRDSTPFEAGELIDYGGIIVEILAVSEDGRAEEVSFAFDVELEHPSLVWLKWEDGVYRPFSLPAVGESTVLPMARVPWW